MALRYSERTVGSAACERCEEQTANQARVLSQATHRSTPCQKPRAKSSAVSVVEKVTGGLPYEPDGLVSGGHTLRSVALQAHPDAQVPGFSKGFARHPKRPHGIVLQYYAREGL